MEDLPGSVLEVFLMFTWSFHGSWFHRLQHLFFEGSLWDCIVVIAYQLELMEGIKY